MTEQAPVSEHITGAIATFSPADAAIAEMGEQFLPLRIDSLDDRDGFKAVREARMVVRGHRVAVEKRRVFLKADALKYGRAVDAEAKRITALLSPIEEHLQGEEDKVAAEKQRIEAEVAEAKRAILQERMNRLAAVGSTLIQHAIEEMTDEGFENSLAVATELHEEKLRKEAKEAEARRIEQERIDRERAELEEQQAEIRAAQARVTAAREELEAEKRKTERAAEIKAAEESAAAKAKQEAEEEAERQKSAEAARIQTKKDEAARLEALRPDVEKLRAFAKSVRSLSIPEVPWANDIKGILCMSAARIDALVVDNPAPPVGEG